MFPKIRKVAVLGAGVMGSGIAAHLANAGISCLMLDIVPPALEDDFARIAECDWIVEVVVENLAIKRDLYAKIEALWKPGIVVSSNTSGISIARMMEGRGAKFRRHFLVTHFFNPVRYMKRLELVSGKNTGPEILSGMAEFGG